MLSVIEYAAPQIAGRDEPFRSEIRDHLKGRTQALEDLAVELLARGLSGRDIEDAFKDETGLKAYIAAKKMSLGPTAKTMREIHFINCWHLGENESDAMWKIYSNTQDGVCIQSTFDRLVASFAETEERVYIGKVQYLDYTKEAIDEGMVFAPFLSKRHSFAHEQELRSIVWRFKDTDYAYFHRDGSPATAKNYQHTQFINKYPDRHGLNVPINVSGLVNAVYVSPTSTSWFTDLVHSMIENLGYKFEIRQSNLAATPPI